ncbi:DUF3644 domain-containing protein [Tetragenococcus halophilus]|uniref:DUF3644 domain-containing protein n=1 Tax=Tetragenococcus halophilus TaxID=51669 RepID=UPI000B92D8E8|nr:DUF3644 domain-containing protein [Tetragenococcus halophilus]MCO8284485.1 DUF3644 domain-containing protein [Tetragenococcus halophilus]MDN6736058.1 DUF3644 domain-containing protein [Tetragenococcus koreensis]GBD66033.1 Uncharacterized protein TEHN7116_0997 [Tetragenococcus halophilus subsp. halophilus]GBD78385.1 Uncharacterized protein TEHN7128_1614 [Tetragenococcus halophilus subsp. halophilus]
MEKLSDRFINKSIESFILGLEIYNKPTINYRIEGFSFFICNAWELMLKAKMINDGKSIYYSDKQDRTLSLKDVINKVYPNQTQPLRINIEKIITLRNTSTHFITEDYETIYAPLFQSNVLSFGEQLYRFHSRDITKSIPQNFLTLSANMEPLTNEQIKLKYTPEIAQRLIFQKNDIETTENLFPSENFSIPIRHNLYQVKSKANADFTFTIDKNGENSVQPITRYKDPAETHKFSYENLVKEIERRLKKGKIKLSYETTSGIKNVFTRYTLNLFINFYDMKNNKKFAFKHIIGNTENYSYSQQAAEFIVQEIKNDPKNIIAKLKKQNKKR